MNQVWSALRIVKRRLFGTRLDTGILLTNITRILDFLYPKDDRIIAFGASSGNAVNGSPGAMFRRVKTNHHEYHAYFITNSPSEPRHIRMNSRASYLILLRAKFLVMSHGLGDFGFFRPSRRTKVISTWHGTPLKRIGHQMRFLSQSEARKLRDFESSVDLFVASSEYDVIQMCRTFEFAESKAILTGQPRNDHLLDYKIEDKKNLRMFLPWIDSTVKVILYAPTFRDECMGAEGSKIELFPFDDFSLSELSSFLEGNNLILLIRTHINDFSTEINLNNPRIGILGFDDCPDIYSVLGDVDFLLSDYGSLPYDYLLLDRPIIYIPYDLPDYDKCRGFLVDYDSHTPGPKVSSFKELESYIEQILRNEPDPYRKERRDLRQLVLSHQTTDSTSRIIAAIQKRYG